MLIAFLHVPQPRQHEHYLGQNFNYTLLHNDPKCVSELMTGEVEAESNLLTEVFLCPFQEHANSLLIILSSWETFQFITISKYGQTIFAGTEVTERMSLLGRSTSLAGLFCLAFLMFGGTVRIQVLRCHFIHKRLSIKTSQISFLDQIPVLFPILIISIIFRENYLSCDWKKSSRSCMMVFFL